ncbi:MAG: hypothetical protein JW735_10560 [Prolixibacteraceae bacterium]|nr:hypothetical protein [Prolixibacteraceae bacterium]
MKQITLLLLIAIFGLQSLNTLGNNNGEKVNIVGILYNHPNNYEGSPYLFPDWKNGKVYLSNGQTAENLQLKFSILSGDLIFYHETLKKLFVVDPISINAFTIYNNTDSLFFKKYEGENLSYRLKNGDFVEMLYNGQIKFMLKHTANISVANELNSKDKIFPRKRYFIQIGENTFETKAKINAVSKLFPESKKEIKRFVNEQHLKRKSLPDIVQLLKYIDKNH